MLGVGADDLILLCARCFAGPGDTIAIPERADVSALPDRGAARGRARSARRDDDAVLTFTCRPNSPTGELRPLPDARPLVVDEAYFEYFGETAIPLIDDGDVIVLRTFSKAFAPRRGARSATRSPRARSPPSSNARQAPAPVSTLSAALAIAALASPPDVTPGGRGARAARVGAARDSASSRCRRTRTSSSCRSTTAARSATRCSARGSSCAPTTTGSGSRSATEATTTCSSRRSRGSSTGPRPVAAAAGRRVRHLRATAETRIAVRLGLDGASRVRVDTGAGIYDHFLEQLAFHAGLDLVVEASGDLETGDHHTVEDTALAFGEALDRALGDRRGIARYGDAVVPMDDALARAAVDLGGRPFAELAIEPEPGMAAHFFGSLAQAGRLAIHVEASGRDAHHVAEAAYKAVGRALQDGAAAGVGRHPVDEGPAVKVAVCDYRAGNIRSVEIAMRRLGAELVDDVAGADLAVLPGVGSAGSAMAELRRQGLDEALRARIAGERPVLGICLGLQLALE